ncbi:hypothetical protein [Arenimonas sp.]|uniref:hypothetical protein n=1 Tax=Arenimonas sp. TaxID=1872635 RepID=UPI0035B25F96
MNKFSTLTKTALTLALLAAGSAASAAVVGHYETCSATGNPNAVAPITTAGHTPVAVDIPDAATLAGLDMLFVTNCSNSGVGAEYTANLANISAAVNAGMTLVVHDRWVDGGAGLVPGSAGISFNRNFDDGANIDFPAGSPILSGPGGTLTDASMDGGNYSNHGFVDSTTLPAGAEVVAHRTLATEAVTVAYPFGAGTVVYSTIPLDAYLGGSNLSMSTIYMPNVVDAFIGNTFAGCAGEGFVGDQLKLCKVICESPLTGKPITPLIRLWMNVYGSAPPCSAALMPALVR